MDFFEITAFADNEQTTATTQQQANANVPAGEVAGPVAALVSFAPSINSSYYTSQYAGAARVY